MKFELGFNKFLEEIGAKMTYSEEENYYEIELNSLEEMEALHRLVHEKTKKYYSFVVDFDRPTIYLDKDV